jgi:hypothetical protein
MRLNRNKLEGKVWGGFAYAHPQSPAGGFADAHPCPFGADSLTRIRNPLRGVRLRAPAIPCGELTGQSKLHPGYARMSFICSLPLIQASLT